MDLPSDVVLELPRITVIGNLEILVENHRGIQKYTSEQICLRVKGGIMSVNGRKLAIKIIEKDYIRLEGIIERIQFSSQ
ncbi:MAG: sporulation protein YqfC [Firmicutes bacterium]|nr:sporulation protein YqfC [Bacillota bacterium]